MFEFRNRLDGKLQPTEIQTGDELVLGLPRNAAWFVRGRGGILSPGNHLFVVTNGMVLKWLVFEDDLAEWYGTGKDPLTFLSERCDGLLRPKTVRWEQVTDAPLRPLPNRLLFRAFRMKA